MVLSLESVWWQKVYRYRLSLLRCCHKARLHRFPGAPQTRLCWFNTGRKIKSDVLKRPPANSFSLLLRATAYGVNWLRWFLFWLLTLRSPCEKHVATVLFVCAVRSTCQRCGKPKHLWLGVSGPPSCYTLKTTSENTALQGVNSLRLWIKPAES